MSENIIENLLNNLLQDRNLRGYSSKWANWKSQLTIYTCKFCIEQHGKIVDISILDNKDEVQAHPNCKCIYVPIAGREYEGHSEIPWPQQHEYDG